jgi:hypothetical protein
MAEHSHGRRISRRTVIRTGVSLGAAATFGGGVLAQAPNVTADIARAAQAWLSSLTAAQRKTGHLLWTKRVEDWHFVPRDRPGVPLGQMDDRQAAAAWDLLGTLLSPRGLDQLRNEFRIEKILGEMTGNPRFRDPGNYAIVIFGEPAGADPWGWRIEGHHLSLTTVIVPGLGLSVTPAFFGAHPAKVPSGHDHPGFRLLGAEEDAAFGLIRSLEGSTRQAAIIGDRSLGNIVAGPGRELSLQSYAGVALSELNEAQRGGVMRILELYTGTMREEIARAAMGRVSETGVTELHFAWAGSLEPGRPHYFRIHGPSALVEYDNTQNGANHVHSVWIAPENVFGRDLLKTHYHKAH